MLSLLGFVDLGSFLRGRAVRPRQFFSEALYAVVYVFWGRANELAWHDAAFCSELLPCAAFPQRSRDLLRTCSTHIVDLDASCLNKLVCVTH